MTNDMIEIHATTTKRYFGEPLFLGEVLKDLVSQALRLERSNFKFVHKRTDDEDAPVVAVFVGSLGDEAIASQIILALESQFTTIGGTKTITGFSVTFAGQMESGLFTLEDTLEVPTNAVLEDVHFYGAGGEFHSEEDMIGEAIARRLWRMGY